MSNTPLVCSVQLLLPDATVFNGGGGLCGSDCPHSGGNHFDGEIFSPPYLFNPDGSLAARPSITDFPATATYGATLMVTTDVPVTKFSLIRVGCGLVLNASPVIACDRYRIGGP